jgi:hypothetical protein
MGGNSTINLQRLFPSWLRESRIEKLEIVCKQQSKDQFKTINFQTNQQVKIPRIFNFL